MIENIMNCINESIQFIIFSVFSFLNFAYKYRPKSSSIFLNRNKVRNLNSSNCSPNNLKKTEIEGYQVWRSIMTSAIFLPHLIAHFVQRQKFLQPSTPYLYGNRPDGTNQSVNTEQGLRLLVGKILEF